MTRIIYIASLAILIGLLGLIGYYTCHRTRLADIEREQWSILEDRWVLDFDIVNRDSEDHTYIIKVSTGDPARQPLQVVVPAGKRFISTTVIFPRDVKSQEVVLEVYRDEEPEPIQVSRYPLK